MSKIIAKTIVTKSKLPEVDFCFNPYIGCTHRCVYCYARFMGRFSGHTGEEWGSYLDWKANATELLEKELPKIKKSGGTVIIGSVTDCYQPIEKELNLTRDSLKVFLKYQIPISILTKNKLACRDLDIISKFESCDFGVSLSLLNPHYQSIIEPGASTPIERIELLKNAKMSRIKTYTFLGPIHPKLTPTKEILNSVLPYSDNIMAEVPNLRCGNWKHLTKALEQLKVSPEEYKEIAQSDSFFDENNSIIERACKKSKTEFRRLFKH